MSEHEDVAESIIRLQGFAFALAIVAKHEGYIREARALLKDRIIKELARAAIAKAEGKSE